MHLSHRTVIALSVIAGIATSGSAFAHGTLSKPASRVYACYQGNPENPTNPACAAAKAIGGAQPFNRSMTGPGSTRPRPMATTRPSCPMASCAAAATASTAAWI